MATTYHRFNEPFQKWNETCLFTATKHLLDGLMKPVLLLEAQLATFNIIPERKGRVMLLFFASQVGSKAFLLWERDWSYRIFSFASPDGIINDHCKENEWENKQEQCYWSKLFLTRSVSMHVHTWTGNFSSHWIKMMIYFIYLFS